MICYAEIEKLRHARTPEPSVVSVYLKVPLDPAGQSELRVRADGLIHECDAPVPEQDREAVAALLAARGREWLGTTVAIFAGGELGLLEALTMRCDLPQRAVFATHPYIRPLLAAVQRCPAYHIVIVDARRGWLASVNGDEMSVTGAPEEPPDWNRDLGGWYGLDTYRGRQRVTQHARHHYQDVAMLLRDPARSHGPVVIGGRPADVPEMLRLLPDQVRARYAGSFAADPHTLTPTRARELADTVIMDWARRREDRLVQEADSWPSAARGLPECLAAVNAGAVSMLLVPDDGMAGGFKCGRCGALGRTWDECPDGGTAARRVPDLLEEMTCRVLDDGGEVVSIGQPGFAVAARLRFPVTL